MMWLKACPRCARGDVLFEDEREGCRVTVHSAAFHVKSTATTRLAGCCSKTSWLGRG